jgi:hypothetical protein
MTAAYSIHGGSYINGYCGIDEQKNRLQEDGGVPEGLAASVEKIKRTKAHNAEKYTMIE